MQRSLITVVEDTPLREVGRLIFSLGLAGIPVVRGKKLIGIVTEKDILNKFHPTVQEYMEDPVNMANFEKMEENLRYFLSVPAKNVMSEDPTTIDPDTPLIKAQSIMLANRVGRLPIVDKKQNLIGIVSQGDIFRGLLKKEIPALEKERYAGFIAKHYDLMVDWKKRLAGEFPALFGVFKKENVKRVLDVGVWTGEYSVNLAKKGIKVVGLDNHNIMINISEEKREKLPVNIKKNISFLLTDYTDFAKRLGDKFDAAILMGNGLPYIPISLHTLFDQISKSLRAKKAVIILQILNFEKILRSKNRLISFIIQKGKGIEKEHLFIELFDNPKGKIIMHHIIIFDSDGENWRYKGITSIPVFDIRKKDVENVLKKFGFKKITFSGNSGEYQGEFGQLSFDTRFDPQKSDFLNVLAIR